MSDQCYDWDDTIEQPDESGGYTLLPAGVYPFTVTKFERARHTPKPNGKIPACNKAIVTIEVDGGSLGKASMKANLYLHSSTEGLLCAFFTSIGDRQHGQPLVMNWPAVVGKTGLCKVGIRAGEGKYVGKEYNEFDRFLAPGEGESANTPGFAPF